MCGGGDGGKGNGIRHDIVSSGIRDNCSWMREEVRKEMQKTPRVEEAKCR